MEFFHRHMGKIPVREKKLIKSLWGFSLSLGCFCCSDKPFPHFLPVNQSSIVEIFRKSHCFGKQKTKNLLIQECWRLQTDVTNTSKSVLSHCSKHFLLPLTKTHNIADFGESYWEETLLSGPGYTPLARHQLTETAAEPQGDLQSDLSNLKGSSWPMADGELAQEAENIHLSDYYLIFGGYDP